MTGGRAGLFLVDPNSPAGWTGGLHLTQPPGPGGRGPLACPLTVVPGRVAPRSFTPRRSQNRTGHSRVIRLPSWSHATCQLPVSKQLWTTTRDARDPVPSFLE